MNPRNTWILAALAAVLFAYILVFERHTTLPPAASTGVLRGFKPAAVTSVQIQFVQQPAIRLERTNGGWQLTEPLVYPAQSVAIESLLRALEQLTSHTQITAHELNDRPNADKEFGFDKPLLTLLVQEGQKTPRQLKFGNQTPAGDEVYLQVVGLAGVEVVGADIFAFVPRKPNDLRDPLFMSMEGVNFNRLSIATLTGAGAKGFDLERDAPKEPWRMIRPNPVRVDNAKIDELMYGLQMLRVSQFVTDEPGADLESLGLQPPQLELAFGVGTNRLMALQFGKSPTNNESLVYARHAGEKTVVLVPRAPVEAWRGPHTEFRDRHLAGLRSAALDSIEVSSDGGEKFTVQRQTNGLWRIAEPGNFPADGPRMRDFIESLARLEVVPVNGQFAVRDVVLPTDFAQYGLDPAKRRYVLKREAAAGGTNVVVVDLSFGTTTNEKDKVYARRLDESSLYAVMLDDFKRLPATSLQLRERRIWNFTEDAAKSLTIRANGVSKSMVHQGQARWPLAANSQGMIDDKAQMLIEAGVGELGELEAENWVERGGQNRAKYGFSEKSPLVSVTILEGDQPKTLVLELGGWSPQGLRYATVQMEGQPWIFELPAQLYVRLVSYLGLSGEPTKAP